MHSSTAWVINPSQDVSMVAHIESCPMSEGFRASFSPTLSFLLLLPHRRRRCRGSVAAGCLGRLVCSAAGCCSGCRRLTVLSAVAGTSSSLTSCRSVSGAGGYLHRSLAPRRVVTSPAVGIKRTVTPCKSCLHYVEGNRSSTAVLRSIR